MNEVVGDTRKRAAHAAGSRELGAILKSVYYEDVLFDEARTMIE